MGRSKRRPTVVRVAQNIYDDPFLTGTPSWIALAGWTVRRVAVAAGAVPPIAGSRVLDLGSGYGCPLGGDQRSGRSAHRAVGADADRARRHSAALPVEFVQADLGPSTRSTP